MPRSIPPDADPQYDPALARRRKSVRLRIYSSAGPATLAAIFCILTVARIGYGEERMLLAADNEVVEINRKGTVTDVLAKQGHSGIYEAWRLPDGGVAYAHKGGLAVYDREKHLVLSHPARSGTKGAESNSCVVMNEGARFALMDSGVAQVRVVDRDGKVLSETPLPEIIEDSLHSRYRTVRLVPGEKAFWVAQYGRRTLLKVAEGSGEILQSLLLDPMLKPTAAGHTAFGVTPLPGGKLWVATSTGRQLLRLSGMGEMERSWSAQELGLTCRYLLGTQQLENGHLLVACGDYHLKSVEEGEDLLAEIDSEGRVVWRFTRPQLVDQIEGVVDSKSGLEEMRITNVHLYDTERLGEALKSVR